MAVDMIMARAMAAVVSIVLLGVQQVTKLKVCATAFKSLFHFSEKGKKG